PTRTEYSTGPATCSASATPSRTPRSRSSRTTTRAAQRWSGDAPEPSRDCDRLPVVRSPDTLTSSATRHRIPARWWPWCSTAARLVLAGVWTWAGVAKLGDPDAAVRAVRAYDILPEGLVKPLAWGLPFVELALAVLLLLGLATRPAAWASVVLLLVFLGATASVWARGLQIECGCFGGGG